MSVKRHQIYKCEICGNIIEVLHEGKPALVCCKQPMKLFEENGVDAAKEKHVPVVEKNGADVKVKVGTVSHPMGDDHYIEWIQVISGDMVYMKYLKPGDSPEAEFHVQGDEISVRAYCNLHGLWRA